MSAVLSEPTAELIAEINEVVTSGGDGHRLGAEGCNNHPIECRGWASGGSSGVGCINCPRGNTCTQSDHYRR